MSKFKVTFYPYNKTVEVEKDTTILSAAVSAGVPLNSVCGGDGVCGRCKVVLKKGSVLMQATGLLSSEEKARGVYLACLSEVQGDLEVEIPPESAADFEKVSDQELKNTYSDIEDIEPVKPGLAEQAFSNLPFTSKFYLELPAPDLDDKVSDLERLYRQINKMLPNALIIQTGIVSIRNLSELLRSSGWKITVTLARRNGVTEIIQIEPGDTSQRNFGMCFDIGTTTVTGQLVDLNKSKVLGTKVAYNKQATFGSDVITRIIYAREPDGLEKLHCAVAEEMNRMSQELIAEHSIDLNDVTCVLCAGNTTMMHLLLRIDPTYIRKEPYVPAANFIPPLRATEAGVKINPRGLLTCVPGVASYVGGDVTSGVLSCGIDKADDLSILIDIGTNGEIVLGDRDFMVSCAASAGPAFEGSGVSCGMRATKGAVQKVKISGKDFNISYETIGGMKAKGICGSGYIDLIAEMLAAGILDKGGKIKDLKHKRIRQSEMGREFVVVFKEDADSTSDIVITEVDIDNLKRAKAAIYSAMLVLLRRMDIDLNDVKKLFIAGGFGTSVDINNAINIGLLPDIQRSRIVFVGNSSLSGARAIILSYEAMRQAEEIARKMTYLELSTEPAYMDEYVAALFFPHTDLARFPSVKL